MVELEWEGLMKREDCSAAFLATCDEVANAAHEYHWPVLLQHLGAHPGAGQQLARRWDGLVHPAAPGGGP